MDHRRHEEKEEASPQQKANKRCKEKEDQLINNYLLISEQNLTIWVIKSVRINYETCVGMLLRTYISAAGEIGTLFPY